MATFVEKHGLLYAFLKILRHQNYFAHIFAGGYAAGYYSYLWSAVLDKDAYQVFKKSDLLQDFRQIVCDARRFSPEYREFSRFLSDLSNFIEIP